MIGQAFGVDKKKIMQNFYVETSLEMATLINQKNMGDI